MSMLINIMKFKIRKLIIINLPNISLLLNVFVINYNLID